jgi:hypothetical protein
MKRTILFVLLLVFALNVIGCDAVYRSQLNVHTSHSIATADAESLVKKFSFRHGYSIIKNDKIDPWVKQEISDENPQIIWIAQKKYEPTILFTSMADTTIVRLVKLSGAFRPAIQRKYTEELYVLLKNKFGEANVSLLEN